MEEEDYAQCVKIFESRLKPKGSAKGELRLQLEGEFLKSPQNRKKTKKNVTNVEVNLTSNFFTVKYNQLRVFKMIFPRPKASDKEWGFPLLEKNLPKELFDQIYIHGCWIFCSPAAAIELTTCETLQRLEMKLEEVPEAEMSPIDLQTAQQVFLERRRPKGIVNIGDQIFDASQMVTVTKKNRAVEIWRGFKRPEERDYEGGSFMSIDLTHLIVGGESLLVRLKTIANKKKFDEAVAGHTVVTKFDNRFYKILGVDYSLTPKGIFPEKGISYCDYYMTSYKLQIKDKQQPMLIAQSLTLGGGQDEFATEGTTREMLPPEICFTVGITSRIKRNAPLMREIEDKIHLEHPAFVRGRIRNFKQIFSEGSCDSDVITGRTISVPKIEFDGTYTWKMNWAHCLKKAKFYRAKEAFFKWYILAPKKILGKPMRNFTSSLLNNAKGFGLSLNEPILRFYNTEKCNFFQLLDEIAKECPRFLMIIAGNEDDKRTTLIKRKLFVENAIPHLLINEDIFNSPLAKSVPHILLQMNTRLGNAPWKVKDSPTDIVYIGMDFCEHKGQEFGAFVSSMGSQMPSYYYSQAFKCNGEKKFVKEFAKNTLKVLDLYRQSTGKLPKGIVVYRNKMVFPSAYWEIYSARHDLATYYRDNGQELKIAFITFDKSTPTKFFVRNTNPPNGTFVSDVVTMRRRRDFYLVSEYSTMNQMAHPTYYDIIDNDVTEHDDQLVEITYKQCFMHFDNTHPIRVPAVAEYAGQLAKLVAESLKELPNDDLNGKLYFL